MTARRPNPSRRNRRERRPEARASIHDLPAAAGDASLLRQVLATIGNALKFPAKPRPRSRLGRREKPRCLFREGQRMVLHYDLRQRLKVSLTPAQSGDFGSRNGRGAFFSHRARRPVCFARGTVRPRASRDPGRHFFSQPRRRRMPEIRPWPFFLRFSARAPPTLLRSARPPRARMHTTTPARLVASS
jgi:hypothetical protein